MNPHLRGSAAHVFVESLDSPVLSDDDSHHLFRVLRLRDGETVTVSDGRGSWRPCVARAGSVVVDGAVEAVPAPPAVTIAPCAT